MKSQLFPTIGDNSGSTPLKYNQKLDVQHFAKSPSLIKTFLKENNRGSNLKSPTHSEIQTPQGSPQLSRDNLQQSNQSAYDIFLVKETKEMKHWINEKRFNLLISDLDSSFSQIEEDYRVKKFEKRKPETAWNEEDEGRYMSPNAKSLNDSFQSSQSQSETPRSSKLPAPHESQENNSNKKPYHSSPASRNSLISNRIQNQVEQHSTNHVSNLQSTSEKRIDPLEYARLVASPIRSAALSNSINSVQNLNPFISSNFNPKSPRLHSVLEYHRMPSSHPLNSTRKHQKQIGSPREVSFEESQIPSFEVESIVSNIDAVEEYLFEEVSQTENLATKLSTTKLTLDDNSFLPHESIVDSRILFSPNTTMNKSIMESNMSILYKKPKSDYATSSLLPCNNLYHLKCMHISSNQSSISNTYTFDSIITVLSGRSSVGKTRLLKSLSFLGLASKTNLDFIQYTNSEALSKNMDSSITRIEYSFIKVKTSESLSIVLYQSWDTTIVLNNYEEADILHKNCIVCIDNPPRKCISSHSSFASTQANSADGNHLSEHFDILKLELCNRKQSETIVNFFKSLNLRYIDAGALESPKSLEALLSQLNITSRSFQYIMQYFFKRMAPLIGNCRLDLHPHDGLFDFFIEEKRTKFSSLSQNIRRLFQFILQLVLFETKDLQSLQHQDDTKILLIDHIDTLGDDIILRNLCRILLDITKRKNLQVLCASLNDAFLSSGKNSPELEIMCLVGPCSQSIHLSQLKSVFSSYFQRRGYPLWKQIAIIERLFQYRRIVFIETDNDKKILQDLLNRFQPDTFQIQKKLTWITISDLLQIDTRASHCDISVTCSILRSHLTLKRFTESLNLVLRTDNDDNPIQSFFILNGSLVSAIDTSIMTPWENTLYHQWTMRNLQNHLLSFKVLQRIADQLSLSDIFEVVSESYNTGLKDYQDPGVYAYIVDLFSKFTERQSLIESDLQTYLIEQNLTVSDLERIFGNDATAVILTLKERINERRKNQKVLHDADIFMHQHQLPIRIPLDVTQNCTVDEHLLAYVHAPTLFHHLESRMQRLQYEISNNNHSNQISHHSSHHSSHDTTLKEPRVLIHHDSASLTTKKFLNIVFDSKRNEKGPQTNNIENSSHSPHSSMEEDPISLSAEVLNVLNQLARFA